MLEHVCVSDLFDLFPVPSTPCKEAKAVETQSGILVSRHVLQHNVKFNINPSAVQPYFYHRYTRFSCLEKYKTILSCRPKSIFRKLRHEPPTRHSRRPRSGPTLDLMQEYVSDAILQPSDSPWLADKLSTSRPPDHIRQVELGSKGFLISSQSLKNLASGLHSWNNYASSHPAASDASNIFTTWVHGA